MGTTFIKLGQFLATRPDIIGEELSKKLEKLQDKLPPFSIYQAKEIIRKDLGEDTFNSIINVFVRRRNKLYSSIIASHREDVEVVFIVMDVFIQKNHVNGTLCCRCYGKYQKKNKKDVKMRKR